MGRFDMLGAVSVVEPAKKESWGAVAATVAGGIGGMLLWSKFPRVGKHHPVLGLLNGFALGGNIARVVTKDITPRKAAENIGAHLVATAGSLALPSHPLIGYLAGAAGSNLFLKRDSYLERLDDTVLGGPKKTFIGDEDYGPVSPAQLATLDRALTPAEQKAVDDFQASQSTAAQKQEEAKPFVNPLTGKLTKVTTAFTPGAAAPTKSVALVPVPKGVKPEEETLLFGRPVWQVILTAIGVIVAGGALYAGVTD